MRVLIVRLSSLGDVVHAAPVLADIHAALAQARIDWVLEEAFVPLARCLAGIDRVIPIALRRWKKRPLGCRTELTRCWHELRREPYDAVIDLQGLVKSALVTRAARLAPQGRRHGLANRSDGSAYEPLARLAYDDAQTLGPRIHVVDRSRELAARALGYRVAGAPRIAWQPPAPAAEDLAWADPRGVLLVHGSAKAVKRLGSEFWVAIGKALVERGLRPLLPWGSAEERVRAEHIARAIGADAGVLPRLPLDRLAVVMQGLRGAIGLDTGLTHLAATLGRSTVQLFLEDKAWRAAAYWEPKTAVLQSQDGMAPRLAAVLDAWERVA